MDEKWCIYCKYINYNPAASWFTGYCKKKDETIDITGDICDAYKQMH